MEQLALSLEQSNKVNGVIATIQHVLDVGVADSVVSIIRGTGTQNNNPRVVAALQWAGTELLAQVSRDEILVRCKRLYEYGTGKVYVPYALLEDTAQRAARCTWFTERCEYYLQDDLEWTRDHCNELLGLIGYSDIEIEHDGSGWVQVDGRYSYVKQDDFVNAAHTLIGWPKNQIRQKLAWLKTPKNDWAYGDDDLTCICGLWLNLCQSQTYNTYRVEGTVSEPRRWDGKAVKRLDYWRDIARYLNRWYTNRLEATSNYCGSEQELKDFGNDVLWSICGRDKQED